jgi:hypothetical protein
MALFCMHLLHYCAAALKLITITSAVLVYETAVNASQQVTVSGLSSLTFLVTRL